jgi:hypothetical protein
LRGLTTYTATVAGVVTDDNLGVKADHPFSLVWHFTTGPSKCSRKRLTAAGRKHCLNRFRKKH